MSSGNHDPASESLDRSSEIPRGDPVSDVLETIRLQGAVFFLWEPGWPYGIGVADGKMLCQYLLPESDCIISYHIVTSGPCWAAVENEAPMKLETGDTLVLPHGNAYKIANTPQYPEADDVVQSIRFFQAMSAGDLPPVVTNGGPGPRKSGLICGFLGCSAGPYNPLLSSLPAMIRIPAPLDNSDPLSGLIAFALTESRQQQGGERCLLMRLSEVMFIEVLRRYMRSDSEFDSGWMAGLRDPVLGRALELLHRNIADRWTLQKLADSAGVSRSSLAERFTRVIGLPPMQYLTHWRMQAASSLLKDTRSKVYAIASEVGYDSEQAFSRAFKRATGKTPRQWRDGV